MRDQAEGIHHGFGIPCCINDKSGFGFSCNSCKLLLRRLQGIHCVLHLCRFPAKVQTLFIHVHSDDFCSCIPCKCHNAKTNRACPNHENRIAGSQA
ncbi:hypothetical protein D3C80_1527170 [compost metagenome]